MTEEALSRATRGLRELHDGSSPTAARSRAAILMDLARRRRRRRSSMAVVLPIAAVFAVSSAWAAATGRLTPWLKHLVLPESSVLSRGRGPNNREATGGPPSCPLILPAPPPSESPSVSATSTATMTEPAVPPVPQAHARLGATSPAGSSTASASAEEALYGPAHRAHFVSHDPAAALAGWDAYLAAYPQGRFTLEARYNRGLSLVRLGRMAEARVVLAPFAAGSVGGYRQREALALLEALDAGP